MLRFSRNKEQETKHVVYTTQTQLPPVLNFLNWVAVLTAFQFCQFSKLTFQSKCDLKTHWFSYPWHNDPWDIILDPLEDQNFPWTVHLNLGNFQWVTETYTQQAHPGERTYLYLLLEWLKSEVGHFLCISIRNIRWWRAFLWCCSSVNNYYLSELWKGSCGACPVLC